MVWRVKKNESQVVTNQKVERKDETQRALTKIDILKQK